MNFDFIAQPAIFVARPNRYVVHACLASGAVVIAHCADPGRLAELLIPGARVYLSPAARPRPGAPLRKTAWDLRFVEHPESARLISLDTRVPNALFAEGLASGFFPELGDSLSLHEVRREVSLPVVPAARTGPRTPHSRADYRLMHADGSLTWVEVKSASLVVEGVARFPDAITARGRRHALELAALARSGTRTAIVFIVQRPDADALTAHRGTDPAFADALDEASAAGVRILAATCRLTTAAISLDRRIPVLTRAENAANES
jgi:sugar fermentation stimulation protein A